ncbi:MAG: hypothetical protein ACTSPY_06330 [Candidatus Helarchaeota archaeon]
MPLVQKTIRVPESHCKIMDILIENKLVPCYSEIVRVALDRLIAKDLEILKTFNKKIDNDKKIIEIKEEYKQKRIDEYF